MRIVKEAEVRRNEILDIAEELFAKKGFDNTSTNDILKKVNIARGTLYYHFKSKEDILDGVINRVNQKMVARATVIVRNKHLPLLNRITEAILALNISSDLESEVIKQIHKPQNALMHQKIQMQMITDISPILCELVNEGIEKGLFHTEYAMGAVEMIMLYASIMFDDLTEQTPEQRNQRIQGFIYNIEKMLGTENGLLQKALLDVFEHNSEF